MILKDSYYLKARLFPAILTSIPMLLFFKSIFGIEYKDALHDLNSILPLLLHFGLSSGAIFLCIQVNRILAKEIFQRLYFKDELFMPTTSHLLLGNDYYPDSIKQKIRQKAETNFGISLLSRQKEIRNEIEARRIILTVNSQIRAALRDNKMLLRHNIEYGFWRNLLGGCVLAIVFSALIFVYGGRNNVKDQQTLAIILLSVYLIPVLLSKIVIKKYGKYYSKILFEQFLAA